jgi:predicted hydrolase (HD superfamily)
MDRATAVEKLHEWVESPSLSRHCFTVEHVMRCAATRYGGPDADADLWGVTGLLHDADYEKFPDEHPRRIVAWLRDRGEEAMAYAVECHAPFMNVPCRSMLDKALFACDELTGLIVACALMRPDGVMTMEPSSAMKKFKDKKFAAGVNRDDVSAGVKMLGVELSDHIGFVIDALRQRAAEFNLAGRQSL